ncbi:hypothetical protein Y032_0221g2556 [Ancylostoma ceylanicum]|uniref:Uncharacterized protein n=1 Tax=Ancylostoma ceylanicum TaxID=53326 RepID=A0A016SJ25_9BILA|nr:hypothetical protein Y032_0221g2556 [Ancylostoma ceylanicum]
MGISDINFDNFDNVAVRIVRRGNLNADKGGSLPTELEIGREPRDPPHRRRLPGGVPARPLPDSSIYSSPSSDELHKVNKLYFLLHKDKAVLKLCIHTCDGLNSRLPLPPRLLVATSGSPLARTGPGESC